MLIVVCSFATPTSRLLRFYVDLLLDNDRERPSCSSIVGTGEFNGDGSVDSVFGAINAASGVEATLREFRIDAVTEGNTALAAGDQAGHRLKARGWEAVAVLRVRSGLRVRLRS